MDRIRPAPVVVARSSHLRQWVRWRLGLLALCLLPWGAPFGAAADAGRIELRDARVEQVPIKAGAGRFRLAAHLDITPARSASAGDGPLRLRASLQSKAALALCPVPGTIFADGFDAP
jgi:hypothetical protein